MAHVTPQMDDPLGVRYLPPHLEDPRNPGWLTAEETRRRRRSWAKCRRRERMYQEAFAAGATCANCGTSFSLGEPPWMAIDHIIPIARGGTDVRANLQVLCDPCNLRKGAKL